MTDTNSVTSLMECVHEFADRRDWAQFHDPKNLAMALASEVGELNALLRWVRNEDADDAVSRSPLRERLLGEVGDVGILLLALCSRARIDLGQAVVEKLRANEDRYPAHLAMHNPERPHAK